MEIEKTTRASQQIARPKIEKWDNWQGILLTLQSNGTKNNSGSNNKSKTPDIYHMKSITEYQMKLKDSHLLKKKKEVKRSTNPRFC